MINAIQHKAVVVVNNGGAAYGFPHIYSAIAFIERQVPNDKAMRTVIDSVSDEGIDLGADNFKVMSTDDYLDAYAEDEIDESIDTLEVTE